MAKKMSSTTAPPADSDAEDDGTGRVSHRERSEESRSIAGLAGLLVAMKPAQLGALPLPPDVADAVLECQKFTKNARARQLRRVGKLLRQVDHVQLRIAVTEVMRGKGARSQREKTYEAWRERLLTDGDAALAELLAQHEGADAQRLRQLVRLAVKDPAGTRGSRAARELLRRIRELGEATATSAATAAADTVLRSEDDDEEDDPEGR